MRPEAQPRDAGRVDAHHHLWRYTAEEYGWIDEPMRTLRRDFLPAELQREAAGAGVGATIAVQARQTLEETEWLLGLAAESARAQGSSQSGLIAGVVGWAPLAAPEFPTVLDGLRAGENAAWLKGLRHVVQAEPAGFLDGEAFNRGIAALAGTELVYDILIVARQLAEATRFVDRHPRQSFVLDHIAKPEILHDGFAPWSAALRELARRENVCCKLSGMVTEADWSAWSADSLRPYFDTVLEAFGPARLMAGTDWPVLTVACSYAGWWQVLEQWTAPLSAAERAAIEGATAARVYTLNLHPFSSRS